MGSYTKLLQQQPQDSAPAQAETTPPQSVTVYEEAGDIKPAGKPDSVIARKRDSQPASRASRKGASTKADMPASLQASEEAVAFLRKLIKQAGKEPFFGRFTPEEKATLAEIVYTYKRAGLKTSENEIARLAVNWLVRDYQMNGEKSLLDRVIKALNS